MQKLVEFIYRDSIKQCGSDQAIELLVLFTIYNFPSLRAASVQLILQLGINSKNALCIWRGAVEADEVSIRQDAAMKCASH